MRAIYEPQGAAREYASLALNLFRGCTGGCKFCYVPGAVHRKREDFHAAVTMRPDILRHLSNDLSRNRITERVFLSFSSDPWPVGALSEATRTALIYLSEAGVPVATLTKSGARAARDLDILSDMDTEAGISLVWSDDRKRAEWEPGAAPVAERLEYLAEAKRRGIKTWASVEPVIELAEALAAIERLIPVADVIKVGRWNHDKAADAIDWRSFAVEVKARLEAAGVRYMLKKGLAELADSPAREVGR